MATETPPRENIIRAFQPAVEIRADDGEDTRPVLFGHFARFNEWTEIDSFFEGHFMERIAPGAFKKTFRDRGDQLRVLFQHGRDPEIGDKPIAEVETLREDPEGAYHESRLLDGIPELVVAGLRAGQYGQSFRMEVMREEMVDKPEASDDNPHGLQERTIKEVRLYEFGPVTFPAYENTTPAVRSLTDRFVFGWIERYPERARDLIGAHELRSAALDRAEDHEEQEHEHQDPAPSDADAAHEGTSDAGAPRFTRGDGRYGLVKPDSRPRWAL